LARKKNKSTKKKPTDIEEDDLLTNSHGICRCTQHAVQLKQVECKNMHAVIKLV
jgi:hypothetical protein